MSKKNPIEIFLARKPRKANMKNHPWFCNRVPDKIKYEQKQDEKSDQFLRGIK